MSGSYIFTTLATVLFALPANAMVFLYARENQWHKTLVGWSLMTVTAGFAMLADVALARIILGGEPWWLAVPRMWAVLTCVVGFYLQWIAWRRLRAARRQLERAGVTVPPV